MKLKPKQKPNPLILGLGTDANDEQSRLINKVDVDKFFGEEQKELMSNKDLKPHESGAVLEYIFNKYDIKNKYKTKYPDLNLNKKFDNYDKWRVFSDSVAVNNPNKFLKSEDVISDPKDLELYKKALKDRQRFFPNSTIDDVKGTGSQPYEIGFRTVTMPWSTTSTYEYKPIEGEPIIKKKKWVFDGKGFRAIPL